MNNAIRIVTSTLLSAVIFTALAAVPAMAQDKAKPAKAAPAAVAPKVILENDKVRIIETRYKPGAGGPMQERLGRATYSVKGGTFERTYADGRKEKIVTKTGEWRWLEKASYSFQNIGKSDIVLNTVYPK